MTRSPVVRLERVSPSRKRADVAELVPDDDESFRQRPGPWGFLTTSCPPLEVGDYVWVGELPSGNYVVTSLGHRPRTGKR